ncbi:MAG: flagellin FliC [Candidatus Caenarcaniphilales bacterium]|nr:flagellin FliC [Candidatus Caenarcaniphilales bacterium]
MGIIINTNTQSLFAQRSLRTNTKMVEKSIERLSTGFRINRAGDDAAGLSISQKMTTLIRGMDQAKRNIGDGMAMISTLDGALSTVQDNLQRIRELTVQAFNGTNSEDELSAIQREINERVQAIDDMGTQAKFNGVNLLDGQEDITLQIGAEDGNTLVMKTSAGTTSDVGFLVNFSTTSDGSIGQGVNAPLSEFTIGSTGVASLGGTSGTPTSNALTQLDTMINNISRMRSTVGAYENSLQSNLDYLDRYAESLRGARSRIMDADIAAESSEVTKAQILQQSAATMLTQANSTPQLALNLLP